VKKIVFCNIMMREDIKPSRYKVNGNSAMEYDGEVMFPVNGVLAGALTNGDEVKVVLLKKDDIAGNSGRNVGRYISELDRINAGIGAKIEYKVLTAPNDEGRKMQENMLRDIVGELTEGAHIYADITYGMKSLPIIVFSALSFAEKFFKAEIKSIVYGKVDFDKDDKPINHELFDMTALFYLNFIANAMECKDGEAAKKLLDTILSE
jgi:hypothetical protein